MSAALEWKDKVLFRSGKRVAKVFRSKYNAEGGDGSWGLEMYFGDEATRIGIIPVLEGIESYEAAVDMAEYWAKENQS